jgi:hypothetical protein
LGYYLTFLPLGQLAQRSVLNGIAAHLASRTINGKWRTLLRNSKPAAATELLFPGVPVAGPADDPFAQQGWQRGPVKLRQLSQSPDPNQVTNLLFKLRSLFGVQARAEVMAFPTSQPDPMTRMRLSPDSRRSMVLVTAPDQPY